jgi:hypothetical protein
MPSLSLYYAEYSPCPAPVPAPAPVKTSVFVRGWKWIKYVLTCCRKPKTVEEPALPVHDPCMPGEKPAMYQTQGGMRMWDPNSGTPCPHLMTQTNPRTNQVICIGCRKCLVEGNKVE